MNGPLAIFRQPHWHSFYSANFSILSLSLSLARARAFGRHRCPNHSSSRRYFSSLLSHRAHPLLSLPPLCQSSCTPLHRAHRSALRRKEGPRMGNEGVIDGIRVTQSTPTAASSHNEYTDRNEFLDPVNRQSLN